MSGSALRRALEREIERIEPRPRDGDVHVPTGIRELDALLPLGGLPRGRSIEWAGPASCGKTSILRAVLARLRASGEPTALIDTSRTLYAPDWEELVRGGGRFWVVRPPDAGEAAWCADLLLRSGAFGAVALEATPGRRGDAGILRRGIAVRLQRLAEEAGTLLLVVGELPLAGLRLRFRPGKVEPLGDGGFGPFLPRLHPVWVRIGGGEAEVPLLCPSSGFRSREGTPVRDRKGPR